MVERRPAASAFHHPLDLILGARSRIRLLRILAVHGGEISPTVLAMRAGLTRAGAWRALLQLEEAGIVERVAVGRSAPFRINRRHPQAKAIIGLFKAEASRLDEIFKEVQSLALSLDPVPLAVWLFGSVARGQDRAASDLDIAVVVEEEADREAIAAFRRSLLDYMSDWAAQPSVIALTRADVRRMGSEGQALWSNLERDAVTLFGASLTEIARG